MSNAAKTLHPLISAQRSAVFPHDNIWLSASAGTGKTQVLTARVIRLLLENDVEPENLLCITFTKAGASEMADRINQLLASWVHWTTKSCSMILRLLVQRLVQRPAKRRGKCLQRYWTHPAAGCRY